MDEAVKKVLSEDNALFDSQMGKLNNYSGLNTLAGYSLPGDRKIAGRNAHDNTEKLLYTS